MQSGPPSSPSTRRGRAEDRHHVGRDSRVPRRKRARGPRVYQRAGGEVWWAYLDRETRVSLDTTDEAEAHRRLAERLAQRVPGAARPARGEATLERIGVAYMEAPHGWSKRNAHTNDLRVASFIEAMAAQGVIAASHITEAVLDAWRARRMTEAGRATINRDEVVARSMLAWGKERGLCGDTPLATRKLLREPKRQAAPIIPSPATVRRVLAAMRVLADEIAAAPVRKYVGEVKRAFAADAMRGAALTVETALLSGLRLDELRHLRSEHVSSVGVRVAPEAGTADEAWSTKGYRERLIPLAPDARRVVGEYLAWRVAARGGQGRTAEMAQTWLADKIRAGCGRVALDEYPVADDEPRAVTEARDAREAAVRFDPHDLRRTFATECVRGGIPLTVVRDWLGHRDVQTTERYLGRYAEDALLVVPYATPAPPAGCTQSCTQPCTQPCTQHPRNPGNS